MDRKEFKNLIDIYARAKSREDRQEAHLGRVTSVEVMDVLMAEFDRLNAEIKRLKDQYQVRYIPCEDIADKLLIARRNAGITQQELATRSGYSRNYISMIERKEAGQVSSAAANILLESAARE